MSSNSPMQPTSLLTTKPMSMIIPDANVGVYYTNQGMFAGMSVFNLMRASVMFGNNKNTDFRMKRQYNMIGGF